MPQNSLTLSRNEIDQTRPRTVARRDKYGRIQIGGSIGAGDIQNAMAADRQIQMGAELAQDIMPVIETVRSAQRLPEQWQAYKEAESPIQQGLRAADMALEGGAMVADLIPYLKAAGATAATLVPLMMRRNDELDALAKYGIRQRGLIGYHGSPHKFDKFSHDMMGSGEGAQAYGWGTYIAENPKVAKSYAPRGEFHRASDSIDLAEADWDEAVDIIRKQDIDFREPYSGQSGVQYIEEFVSANKDKLDPDVADYLGDITRRAEYGNFYEVDLPDEQIAKMLDWDAPVEFEDPLTRQILDDFPDEFEDISQITGAPGSGYEGQPEDGRAIYQWLSAKMGGDEKASAYLASRDYPGIKYWDGGSRQAGSGTRNFVVFDENDMTILKRNDEVLNANPVPN